MGTRMPNELFASFCCHDCFAAIDSPKKVNSADRSELLTGSPVRWVHLAHDCESPERKRGVRDERARMIQQRDARDSLRGEKYAKARLRENGHRAAAGWPLLHALELSVSSAGYTSDLKSSSDLKFSHDLKSTPELKFLPNLKSSPD